MPSDLIQLNTADWNYHDASSTSRDASVDIVAVHGLNEDMRGAWTDSRSQNLWLRDLLPKDIPVARVLTFGYDAFAASFYRAGCSDTIQKHAHTLIASLQADRSIEGCDRRPIVFVCHGLGGILVKKALAYSESRTSAQVVHLNSIFVSTFGILFFSTPHNGLDIANWIRLESGESSQVQANMKKDDGFSSDTLATVTDQFAPLMKQFRIFFFWEEVPTDLGYWRGYIVEESSAAPLVDNTERSGIDATHSGMIKFSTAMSSSYRTVIAALRRYCIESPRVISHRWEVALAALAQARSNEAFELAGMALDVRQERFYSGENTNYKGHRHKHFYPPQQTTTNFVGRNDTLEMIRNALSKPEQTDSTLQRRFVVHGMGGSGKTQLASKFARDNQERYSAIFTIHAASMETAKESFAKIGKLGGLGDTESAGKYWLAELEEPWLLIIDNADNPDLDLPLLFPESGWGHILITTRNPDFRTHGSAGSVKIEGLEKEEALLLLLKQADVPRPWDASTEATGNEITRSLGYLALAVIQAGTSIFRKICDLTDYLNFHNHYRRQRRARSSSISVPEHDDDMVYSSFDFSIMYLEKKNTGVSRDAMELLNVVGFYHFEHIRVDIFTRAIENRHKALNFPVSRPISMQVRAALLSRLEPPPALPRFLKDGIEGLDPYRMRRALHELYSLSLINYDGKDASFSLHPLIHAWARDRLDSSAKAVWAQIALNTLTEAILLPPNDSGELHGQFRKDLLPHIEACLSACPIVIKSYNSRLGRLHLSLASFFQQTLKLIIRGQVLNAAKCGYVYAQCGRFEEATIYLSMVKDTLVQLLGYEDEKTMSAMLGLAGTLWGLGRLEEAISLQKRVTEARMKAFGPKSRQALLVMDQLGSSYWLNGQYHEALSIQQLTTDHMKQTLGRDHDDTLAALDNLGVTLGSWQRYEESEKIHREVLLARNKRLGATNLDTLTTMNNLAMTLLNQSRPNEAKAIMKTVFEQRKVQLGKEHPWTLWALCNLAKINTELGLLRESEFMLVDGIAAGKRSLSETHLGVLMGIGVLVRVYARQGRLDEAEELAVDMIQKLEETRGREHPDTVYALWKLAIVYEHQDEIPKAIRTCELALERAAIRLKKDHPQYGEIEARLYQLRSRPQEKPEESLGDRNRSSKHEENIKRYFKPRSQRTW